MNIEKICHLLCLIVSCYTSLSVNVHILERDFRVDERNKYRMVNIIVTQIRVSILFNTNISRIKQNKTYIM